MRKESQPPEPEDERLRDVLYCIGDGLRKLVPTRGNWGAPPFTRQGSLNSRHSKYYSPNAPRFLRVTLRAWHAAALGKWLCAVTVQDGDDFILQRFCDFDWEEWYHQVDIYEAIESFDDDMRALLREEGFG